VILETAIIFGNWINERASIIKKSSCNKEPNSIFFGFYFWDKINLWFGVSAFLILIWFSIFYIYPLYLAVLNLMNVSGVPQSIPYISITFSFIAITLTLFICIWNSINNVFTKVQNRNHDIALHKRLDTIENALRGSVKLTIAEEQGNNDDYNENQTKLSIIFITILGMGVFVFVTSLIILSIYPTKSDDITIAVFAGVISGGFILLFQRRFLKMV